MSCWDEDRGYSIIVSSESGMAGSCTDEGLPCQAWKGPGSTDLSVLRLCPRGVCVCAMWGVGNCVPNQARDPGAVRRGLRHQKLPAGPQHRFDCI
jgi:hypothetical protein